MSTREAPFKIGDTIAEKYEVKALLGSGGQAFVYECHDRFLDEVAAIKVIPDPAQRGEELRRRAREEARLLYRLRHPNVVAVRDAGETAGMVYIVMEKLEGITLRTMLQKLERLSLFEALVIARQIADGVSVAHAQAVVHRDLKPENVFILAPDNHVKVLDFGIAKFQGQGHLTTEHDVLHGTVAYMSPEHLQGKGVTARSDVYQLGLILFEMLAGVSPCLYDVEDPTFEQLAWIQISRPTPDLNKVVPNVPPSIEWLVRQATAKNPDLRFASMQAMRTALEASAREYIGSVPKSTLKIRLLKPPGANDTGPGFSATMPSPRQLDYLTRAVALDADRMSGAALAAVDGGQAGTFRLTPTPRPDESFAPGTAPSVSRTIPGSAKARSNYGELDDPFVPKPRSSWGKLALVAIPLGAVIGLTLNALQPREQAADPAAAAASVATPPAVVEPPPTTPPPPATIPPSPVASDPPPSPSVTAVATVTPPPVRAPSVRKRTTAAASSTAPSPPPSPPPTKADSAKTEPPKSDAPKTDLDRMRERARKFEEETRGTGKAP